MPLHSLTWVVREIRRCPSVSRIVGSRTTGGVSIGTLKDGVTSFRLAVLHFLVSGRSNVGGGLRGHVEHENVPVTY